MENKIVRTIKRLALTGLWALSFPMMMTTGCAVAPSPDNSVKSDSDDKDLDGVPNLADNCPGVPNPDQLDTDLDGAGDACDQDDDGDNVPDGMDNCPLDSNFDQANQDRWVQPNGDELGDECDPDDDADGDLDVEDNCPHTWNPDQVNTDGEMMGGDAMGDACDSDCDGDGIANFVPGQAISLQNCGSAALDRDGDGFLGDVDCRDDDPDINPDADDVCDGIDNDCDGTIDDGAAPECPDPFMPVDTDGDGVFDHVDNCDALWNENQANADGDAWGDVCDPMPNCNPEGVEICNGLDDDCDGNIDEGFVLGGACDNGQLGECHMAGTMVCGEAGDVVCSAGQVQPGLESCNGLDDDCDGMTDEDDMGNALTQSCYTGPVGTLGVGTCMSGTTTCSMGQWGACDGEVTPVGDSLDFCGDGLDHDCDGSALDADCDMDTVTDANDNCLSTWNMFQGDRDEDTIGDACDASCLRYYATDNNVPDLGMFYFEYSMGVPPQLNGLPPGPWHLFGEQVVEICVEQGEALLVNATPDGIDYAIEGICIPENVTTMAGAFMVGASPLDDIGPLDCEYRCNGGGNGINIYCFPPAALPN